MLQFQYKKVRHLNLSSQESSSFMMPSFSVMRIDQLLMKTTFWHEHPTDDVKTRIKILSQFLSHQKMGNFLVHLLVYLNSLSEDAYLLKRLRKSWKVNFRCSVPRKSVQVRYHFKWFSKPYNRKKLGFKFYSLCSEILKIPEFILLIAILDWPSKLDAFDTSWK